MKVNVNELDVLKKKIDKDVESYENIVLNYYNELNGISNYWKDGDSFPFFDSIDKTSKKVNENLSIIYQICHVYDFIIEQYKKITDKVIDINFDDSDKVNEKFNQLSSELEKVNKQYHSLDFQYIDYYYINLLDKEKARILNSQKKLAEVKKNNNLLLSNIKEIEFKVKDKLSKINMIYIQEETYDIMLSQTSNIMMDTDEVEKSIKKLEMYKKEEDLLIEDIKKIFTKMSYFYRTDNQNDISQLISIVQNNLKMICSIHEKNILKLVNHKNSYIQDSIFIMNSFEKLGE